MVFDNKDLTIGLLSGKQVTVLIEKHSMVFGKTKHGGQSARRYQAVRKEIIKQWVNDTVDLCHTLYDNNLCNKIILGGAGPAKDDLAKKLSLDIMYNVGSDGLVGLEELLTLSLNDIEDDELIKEKQILNEFFLALKKGTKAVYGLYEVKKADELKLLSKIIVVQKSKHLFKNVNSELIIVSNKTREGAQFETFCGIGGLKYY